MQRVPASSRLFHYMPLIVLTLAIAAGSEPFLCDICTTRRWCTVPRAGPTEAWWPETSSNGVAPGLMSS
jgi:hypothetical protein